MGCSWKQICCRDALFLCMAVYVLILKQAGLDSDHADAEGSVVHNGKHLHNVPDPGDGAVARACVCTCVSVLSPRLQLGAMHVVVRTTAWGWSQSQKPLTWGKGRIKAPDYTGGGEMPAN